MNKIKLCRFLVLFWVLIFSISYSQAQTMSPQVESPLFQDTLCHFNSTTHKSITKQFILPLALFGSGYVLSSDNDILDKYEFREERNESFKNFHTQVDNYLQFAPLAVGYGMIALNGHVNTWHYTRQIVLAEFILGVTVTGAKTWTKVLRPDGSSKNSFPSGHTAQAFASATLFADYFAQDNPWLKTAAYLAASSVGVLRVMNNRHWVPDVIGGAGLGIVSAKLSAYVFEKKCHKKHSKKSVILNGF